MTDKTIIGQRIAKLRKNLGLTQAELADKLGVSHQAVSQWERSETLPDILTLPLIAEVFGESISYLLGITETPKGKYDNISAQTDENNGSSVFDLNGVRVEISHLADSVGNTIRKLTKNVEEIVQEAENNTVEVPLDSGNCTIVLEMDGKRVKVPLDLQDHITVILQGDCEDVSCDFALRIEGDVEGDVSAIGSVSVGGDVNGDISTNEAVAVGGDVSGDIDTNGTVSVGGDVSGDIDTNSCISVGGDVDGDIDADGDIRISGDLNGDANAEGNITVHGDMN